MNRVIRGTVIAATFGDHGAAAVGEVWISEVDSPDNSQAIELVIESADGHLWVWSQDRIPQINLCPLTGRQARTPITERADAVRGLLTGLFFAALVGGAFHRDY